MSAKRSPARAATPLLTRVSRTEKGARRHVTAAETFLSAVLRGAPPPVRRDAALALLDENAAVVAALEEARRAVAAALTGQARHLAAARAYSALSARRPA